MVSALSEFTNYDFITLTAITYLFSVMAIFSFRLPSAILNWIPRVLGDYVERKVVEKNPLEKLYDRACKILQVTSTKYPSVVAGSERSVHYNCANIIDFVDEYNRHR